jgi:beta-glucanase (GH16 family)
MKFTALFIGVLVYAAGVFAAPPTGYSLTWSDEFETGTTLNSDNWSYDVGGGGWGNNELEYYTDGANVTIENGCANLLVKQENMGGRNYTSSRINTQGKKEFKYGYFEVRLKAPKGKGLWPAFWTLGSNIASTPWPACGELELYEQRTGDQEVSGSGASSWVGNNCFIATCHFMGAGGTSYNSQQNNYTACLCDTFHTYALLWDSLGIQYFFDGVKFWDAPDINQSSNFEAFHQPHFFIANIAVGGNYLNGCCTPVDNSIFPQKLSLDYIRVYQAGTSVSYGINKGMHQPLFSLMDPSTAQLKVYNVAGNMVADFTRNVRMMKTGSNAMNALPGGFSNGIYIARLMDNGKTLSRKFVIAR